MKNIIDIYYNKRIDVKQFKRFFEFSLKDIKDREW